MSDISRRCLSKSCIVLVLKSLDKVSTQEWRCVCVFECCHVSGKLFHHINWIEKASSETHKARRKWSRVT